jgi:polyisoprenoid-binding protein YceI
MKKLIIAALLLLPSSLWASDAVVPSLTLDAARSAVHITSIKKGHVAETHHFTRLSGGITGHDAQLSIDLASIETGIAKRNERMQQHLFEVANFATAIADVTVDPTWLTLPTGTVKQVTTKVAVDLHGVKKTLNAALTIIATNDGVLVTTSAPLLLKATDFGLDDGIEKLRTLAKLPSIARAVPVDVQLYFTPAHHD